MGRNRKAKRVGFKHKNIGKMNLAKRYHERNLKQNNVSKRINFLLIVLLVAGTSVFTSCKKEAKIEKNLWNKGGEWKIEKLHYKQTSSNPDPEYNFEETLYDYGTYTFNKDGSGNYTITVDGDVETGTLTYSNTEDKLTLIILNQPLVYNILEWEKGKMTISISDNFISNGNPITSTETLNLKKK